MNSIFHIKDYVLVILLLVSCHVFTQDLPDNDSQNKSKKITIKDWQKLGFAAIEYAQPIATGDNFLGIGMSGKSGFNVKAQFFIYKHIFISGTIGTNYFNVIDKSVVGNYNKTEVNHQYINFGYEVLPSSNTRLGFSLSVYGESEYRNKGFTNNREAFQNDDARVRSYETYFDYMINDEFAVYINYSYRNDKMNIQTAPEIQSLFEKATFHNIGIGIKIYFGQSDIISGI